MLNRLKYKFVPQFPLRSYSQSGEDIIVRRVLSKMEIFNPAYLDIGANDPVRLNNTFLLYKNGGHGVLVEPNPNLCRRIKGKRKKDIVLNVGVGLSGNLEAEFFVMDNHYLSTFSRTEAEKIQNYGKHKITQIKKIKLIEINTLIAEHFVECPHFISIDVEGLDFQIVSSLDFGLFRPAVICIETISYTGDNTEHKRSDIIDYLKGKDYLHFADTYINSIFVDSLKWKQRGQLLK